MKNFNKIINIILISLAITIGVAFVVLYIIDKTNATNTLDYIVEILNKPLPIIGITTGAVLLFVWKIIISSNYGKAKIKEYEQKVNEIEQAKKDFEETANEKVNEMKEKYEKLKAQLIHACELSTNQKIKNFGKELLEYGKETINSDTKEE